MPEDTEPVNHPLVSIIIPCYNEQKTIGLLLDSLAAQTYPQNRMEVVISDALSTDATREVINEYQLTHPTLKIKVVDNPQRIIPAGLNAAIRASSGQVITRMDAHSIPAKDYVALSVSELLEGKGQNVGGVIVIRPGSETWIGRSISVATAHPLGVGDARYRWTTVAGPADTVAFGTFYRSLFDQVGFYDENLLVNEDYELNTRIRLSGGTIWIDPAIRAEYYSRGDLKTLAKQYFIYGYWKFKMLKRYPRSVKLRQVLPPLFVLGILMLLLASFIWSIARILLGLALGLYLLALVAGSILPARNQKSISFLVGVPAAIVTMHFSWGSGFIWSMLHWSSTK